MEDNKKKGLGMVLEGGGMRGLYTAGVLDELMEQGIYADSTVGVSAGAIFGCNYKSRQIGRTLRYNTRFCKDKRYMGLKSWITTGDLYSKDFAYGEVPWKLDVFDTETFARSPMKFTVVCTDIETGKPCYQECRMGDRLDVEWMRASASLPLAARPVKLNGRMYLDGGISDPIPVNWMLSPKIIASVTETSVLQLLYFSISLTRTVFSIMKTAANVLPTIPLWHLPL